MERTPQKRERHPMPADVWERLQTEHLTELYLQRPAYQQNDYIGWIGRAKREETREKRICQMMDELRGGRLYMKMAYNATGGLKMKE